MTPESKAPGAYGAEQMQHTAYDHAGNAVTWEQWDRRRMDEYPEGAIVRNNKGNFFRRREGYTGIWEKISLRVPEDTEAVTWDE